MFGVCVRVYPVHIRVSTNCYTLQVTLTLTCVQIQLITHNTDVFVVKRFNVFVSGYCNKVVHEIHEQCRQCIVIYKKGTISVTRRSFRIYCDIWNLNFAM